jgi:hypothetical protein
LRVDHKEDGMIVGLKALRWKHGALYSPTYGTRWDSCVLKAKYWSNQDALRGMTGIHAAWPTVDRRKLPTELWGYLHYHDQGVIAELVGWGQCVVGDIGWRAETVMLRKIYVIDARITAQVQRAYPEVEVLHASQYGR